MMLPRITDFFQVPVKVGLFSIGGGSLTRQKGRGIIHGPKLATWPRGWCVGLDVVGGGLVSIVSSSLLFTGLSWEYYSIRCPYCPH